MPDDDFTDTDFSAVAPNGDSTDADLAATWDRLHSDQPSGHEQAAPAPSYDGPVAWTPQMRQRLSSLPPEYSDVRDYISQREREAQTEISRHGQERAQIRALAEQAGLDANMPLDQVLRHLEHQFGPGHATAQMRQLAESYQRDYEPLKGVLDQYQDTFKHYSEQTPHQTVAQLLHMERMLRTDPNALSQIAQAYGQQVPLPPEAQQQMFGLQQQLVQARVRDAGRFIDTFVKDKDYWPQISAQVAAESEALRKSGLDFQTSVEVAHARVLERSGLGKQLEQRREQEQRQKMDARDNEWRAYLLQHEAEHRAQLQRQAEEHTRRAKRAASVNIRGTPGHNRNPKTMDETLKEVASRLYN